MGDINKKIILIADDHNDFLFQMKMKVERFGYSVVCAESQKEAENIFKTLKPDLAIFDLMMENDDSGFILSYRMKKLYPDVPIIIATGVSAESGYSFSLNSEEEERWIKADLYLDKGIREDQLHKEITRLLGLKKNKQ